MIKTYNVSKEYEKELEHIEKQHNQSRYILELVKADMNRVNENEQILELVRQTLQNGTISNVSNNVNKEPQAKKKQGAMSLFQ